MQLSTSSSPTDPSLLAALFPGAPSAEQAAPLTTEGGFSFEQLLSATPEAASASGDATALNANVLSLEQASPFGPIVPVVCPGVVSVAGATVGDETAFAPGEFHPNAPEGSRRPTDELQMPEENENPALGTTPGQSRRARASRANSFHEKIDTKKPHAKEERPNVTSDVVPSVEPVPIPHLRAAKERNEHAAAAASETPRFEGLPASALAHRASQKTPTGIERLMAARELVATEPSFPSTDASEQPIAGDTASTETLIDSSAEATSLAATHSSQFPERARSKTTTIPVATSDVKVAMPDANEAVSDEAFFSETLTASKTSETDSLPQSPEEFGAFELPSVLPTTFRPSVSFVTAPRSEVLSSRPPADDSAIPLPTDASSLPVADLAVESLPAAAFGTPDGMPQSAAKTSTPVLRAAAEANFAAVAGQRSHALRSADGEPKKSFVAAGEEKVRPHRKSLGIGGAKPDATMSARILPAPQSHPASEYAAAVAPAAGTAETSAQSDFTALPTEEVSSAHEAVEVVLRTIEQASSQEQKSVNLQFSIGDADLAVRVELHADEIRTTFRTDSPELRSALSQEWQAMSGSSSNGERTLRVVPAFLNASEQSTLNAFAGDTSSRQRQPQSQRGADDRSISGISRARAASSAAFAPATSAVAPSAASPTSRHLQTVA